MTQTSVLTFWSLKIGICDLPFDWAQGGEPVEPFVIWCLRFGILFAHETFGCNWFSIQRLAASATPPLLLEATQVKRFLRSDGALFTT